MQPETVNQFKFNFFPDIWADNDKMYLYDTVEHPFPNGRKRREVLMDPLTGKSYESYVGEVVEIGDVALNGTRQTIDSDDVYDDVFDDQFEEDIQEKKRLQEYWEMQPNQNGYDETLDKTEDLDLSQSRWQAYEALGLLLDRQMNKITKHTFSI